MNDVTSVLDTFFTPGAPAPPDAAPPQPPPAADPDLGRTLDLFNAGPQNRFAAQDERLGSQRRLQERQPAVVGLVGRVARKGVPFLSAGVNVLEADAYAGARQRAETGEASNTDLAVIAKYERDRQGDAERGFGGKLVDTGLGLGAIYGEARVGGALVGRGSAALGLSAAPGGYLGRTALATPLTPSLYAERAANKNLEEGRAATDPRGLPPALGLAFLQNLVIGKVPALGAGVPGGLVGRSLASGLGGTAALGGADVAAGLVDEVLPKAYRMDTKYGTIGKLAGIGQPRDVPGALEDAAVSVLAFSVFAGLHNQGAPTPAAEGPGKGLMRVPPEQARTRPSDEVMGAWKDALNHMQENGYTKERAAQETRDIFTKFDGLFKKNPSAGPAEARDLFKDMPDGPIKDFAHTLADQLPTTTAGQARPPVRELPDARKALPAAKVEAAPENPPQSFHSENFEPPAEPISSKNAPGSPLPETGPTARPAGDRPADATPAPGELPQHLADALNSESGVTVGQLRERLAHLSDEEFQAGLDRLGAAVGWHGSTAKMALRPDAKNHLNRVLGAMAGEPLTAERVNDAFRLAEGKRTDHGPLPGVLAKAFPEAKVEDLGAEGLSVGRGDRFLHLKFDPATKRADVAFGFNEGRPNENIDLGRSLSKGSMDLFRDLTTMGRTLKDAGVGVQFEAEPKRAAAFGRILEKAGFKLSGVSGEGQTRRFAFDPVLQSKLGPPQPPPPRVLAKKLLNRERVEAGPKRIVEDVELPEDEDLTAPSYSLGQDLRDRAMAHPDLSKEQKNVIEAFLSGQSNAEIKAAGISKSPDYHRDNAFEKLKAADSEWAKFETAQDALQAAWKDHKADRIINDVEGGKLASIAELRGDPDGPKKVAARLGKLALIDKARAELDNKFLKEAERAKRTGKALSPERIDWFEREALRLDAEEAAQHPTPDQAPPAAPQPPRRAPDARPAQQAAAPIDAAVEKSQKRQIDREAKAREAERLANELPADLQPPAKKPGESEWSHAERDMRQAGAVTLAEEIRSGGGIDPDSLNSPRELALWKENGMAALFKDGRAATRQNKGIQAIDELAMRHAGGDENKLMEMATDHHVVEDSGGWAKLQADRNDWHQQRGKGELATAEPTDAGDAYEPPGDAGSADFNEAEFDPAFVRHGGGPRGRSGKVVLPSWDELKKSNVGRAVRVAADEWYKLRGGQFPRMDALSKPVADRAAALISAPAFAHAAVKFLKRAVYGDMSKAQAARFYTTHAEMRLEYMRRSGKPNAGTLIGPDSPLKTPAEYAATLRDPAFRAYLDRWKKYVVPIMNEHYWDAMGLPHGTPIPTTSQIPGIPINFSRIPEGQTSASAVGSGGKTIKPGNVTQKRFGFNKAATGEHQYETDPEKALENVFRKGAEAAGRATLDREIVARGVGQWGQPGQPIPKLPDGTPLKMVRHVDPEPGTQVAPPRAKTLFIHPDALDEYHNAVGVGNNFRIPLVTPALQGFTRAAIASTVEASFHSATLAGKMLHPYVVRNVVKTMFEALRPLLKGKLPGLSEGQLERLMEMAGGGMTKDRGFESGFLVPAKLLEKFPWAGKLDPTRWAAAFLDTVDNVVRLAANGAFEQMAAKGLVKNTAQNERDFLNDLGNYKEKSQAMVVRILRGTGIGPFATAGTSSQVNAIRALWLSPGVTATSTLAQARLRLHIGLKLAAVIAAGRLIQWLVWGDPNGDEHTPFGAIKTGEKDGRTTFVDPLRELRVRRGLNATGISAMIEDEKLGVNQRTKIHDLGATAQHTLLHPAIGPGVQFGKILTTGNNAMGQRVAGFPEGEGSVEWENFKAAVKNTNPSLAALMGADKAGVREKKPLLPLFTRESVETGLPKLGAPYLMSRKQLPPGVLKEIKEKAASPHREVVVRERK